MYSNIIMTSVCICCLNLLPRLGEMHCWSNEALRMLSASFGITHLNDFKISGMDVTPGTFFNVSLVVVIVVFIVLAPTCSVPLVIVTALFTTLSPVRFTQLFVISHMFLTSFDTSFTMPVTILRGFGSICPSPVNS